MDAEKKVMPDVDGVEHMLLDAFAELRADAG